MQINLLKQRFFELSLCENYLPQATGSMKLPTFVANVFVKMARRFDRSLAVKGHVVRYRVDNSVQSAGVVIYLIRIPVPVCQVFCLQRIFGMVVQLPLFRLFVSEINPFGIAEPVGPYRVTHSVGPGVLAYGELLYEAAGIVEEFCE